ncbi:MAG: TVP38/TMEM64 family protein [Pirellulales bacterium]
MSNRVRILIIAVLAIAASGILLWLPQANDTLVAALQWIDSIGFWGPVLFVVIYIIGCVLFVPGSLLTIGAGMIFGLFVGTITVSIGSTLGAGAAFALARTVLRDWVDKATATMPRFQALDEAVGREGFKVALLTRLSPLFPFNLLNFAFGLTRVSFRDYMLASWIGMLPGAVLYVYIGTAAKSLAEAMAGKAQATSAEQVVLVVGLVATALVMVVLTRAAQKSLAQAMLKSD